MNPITEDLSETVKMPAWLYKLLLWLGCLSIGGIGTWAGWELHSHASDLSSQKTAIEDLRREQTDLGTRFSTGQQENARRLERIENLLLEWRRER